MTDEADSNGLNVPQADKALEEISPAADAAMRALVELFSDPAMATRAAFRPNRFVNMDVEKAEEHRRRALECERRAVLATDDDIRQTFFDLAHQWREIAEQFKELVKRRAALEAATNSGRLSSGE